MIMTARSRPLNAMDMGVVKVKLLSDTVLMTEQVEAGYIFPLEMLAHSAHSGDA